MIDTDILRDILGDHPLCSVQRAELEKAISTIESTCWTPCAEGMPVPKDGVYDVTLNNRNETFGVVTAYVLDGEWVNTGMYTIENIIAYMPKPAPYNPDRKEDQMESKTNEPTTGELIEALRCDGVIKPCEGCFFAFQIENCSAMGCRTDDMFGLAADRLEAQEREIEQLKKANQFGGEMIDKQEREIERLKTEIQSDTAESTRLRTLSEALTARAEQAELARDILCGTIRDMEEPKTVGSSTFAIERRGLPQDGEGV